MLKGIIAQKTDVYNIYNLQWLEQLEHKPSSACNYKQKVIIST